MKMHWCTCTVNLSGQGLYVYDYNQFEALSWPEIQVISAKHGEENVFNIKPVRVSETTPRNEKERLIAKYDYAACERVFPGRVFRMEMMMPGEGEDQPRADDEGIAVDVSDAGQTNADGEPIGPQEPPMSAPVFKPGKPRSPAMIV